MKYIKNIIEKNNDSSGKMLRKNYFKKYFSKYYNIILSFQLDNNIINKSFPELLYMCINNITNTPKCYCGNDLKLKNFKEGYYTYCSQKCVHNDIKILEKTKKTLYKKYNVENPVNIKNKN